ncbi:MAG: GNAT family N-acetyltransferase [Pseudomonadota bacterium]
MLIIERVRRLILADIAACDFSFEITSEMTPPYEDSFRDVTAVAPYRKAYEFEADLFSREENSDDRLIIVARDPHQVRAYLCASRSWNNYAQIDDFAVDRSMRRSGVGRRLMDEAVGWARTLELPGVRLETQSNNVAACRFYQRYGFRRGGFDRFLYSALGQERDEVALFWYLFLNANSSKQRAVG